MASNVDKARLRAHCQRLLDELDHLKSPLPAETGRDLKLLLASDTKDADDFAADVQKLLDPRCLIVVTINPESRVKALRGPAAAELQQGRDTVVLVKVVNEAGVTGTMAVAGPQVRSDNQETAGRWLEAAVLRGTPLGKGLAGDRVEYVLLRLKAHEAGKREATLRFDVGQGTQDIGFRAEVPVLFTVRPAN
jgi:hypothetical protein